MKVSNFKRYVGTITIRFCKRAHGSATTGLWCWRGWASASRLPPRCCCSEPRAACARSARPSWTRAFSTWCQVRLFAASRRWGTTLTFPMTGPLYSLGWVWAGLWSLPSSSRGLPSACAASATGKRRPICITSCLVSGAKTAHPQHTPPPSPPAM